MKYERITLVDGRKLLLRVDRENAGLLSGVEVRLDGDPVRPKGADERRHIIDAGAVTSREPLRMNLTYGELE